MDRRGFRCRGRRPAAARQAHRRMGRRRRRGRIQAGRPRSRRDVRTDRTPATSRSRRARRWPTGRTASSTCTVRPRARCVRSAPSRAGSASSPTNVVIISEYTGGGFGSKGSGTVFVVIPALLSKKTNAPVMMRITRERGAVHRTRAAGAALAGQGRLPQGRTDHRDRRTRHRRQRPVRRRRRCALGRRSHLAARTSRRRCGGAALSVLTNTPPRGAQRAPGGMQGNALMEPIMAKAAHKLGIDQVAIHRINAPEGKAPFGGPNARGDQNRTTSAFVKEALDKGVELFDWEARKARSGTTRGIEGPRRRRRAQRVLGRFDRLRRAVRHQARRHDADPVGHRQSRHRVGVRRASRRCRDRRRAVGEGARSSGATPPKHLPSTCNQGGSQTTHAMTRAAHAAGMDARRKLQEIAAQDSGRRARDYEVADEPGIQRRPRHDAGAGRPQGHRTRWHVRRARAARGHQRRDQGLGHRARRPGTDGRRARQLSARRIVEVVRGRLCRSRGRRRDRRLPACSTCSPSPTSARSSIRAISGGRRSAASCSGWGMPSVRSGSTTSTTACRSPGASIRTGRRPSSTRRRRCDGSRSTSLIPKRRSARAGSAKRRSAPGSAPWSTRSRRRRRRGVQAVAGHGRHDPDGARGRARHARAAHGQHLAARLPFVVRTFVVRRRPDERRTRIVRANDERQHYLCPKVPAAAS